MTKKEKRLEQLLKDPRKLSYKEIEWLLISLWFVVREAEWSHKIIYWNSDVSVYTTVPVHNQDCLPIYKLNMKKLYLKIYK